MRQQVKAQQSVIFIVVVCLTFLFEVATRSTSPDMATVFHARPYGRFIDTTISGERNFIERIKTLGVLEEGFSWRKF